MKQRILHAMLFVALLATISSAAEIGIYFDTAATINCLPEVTTFPYETQAYVIATNCAGFGGVRGWEAGLAWDGALKVSASGVSGQPINVGTFPDYRVELTSALPENETVVLAQLDIVVSGPGGVYLRGVGASAPQLMSATTSKDARSPQPMSHAYGDAQSRAASIGLTSCPEFPAQPVQTMREVPLHDGTWTTYTNAGPGAAIKSSSEIYDGGPAASAGFAGTIVSGELKCVEFLSHKISGTDGPATVLELTVRVTDRYWGQVPAIATVCVLGYELAGCTRIAADWGLPSIGLVVPQARCFVAARREGGGFLVSPWESFTIIDSSKSGDVRRKSLSRFESYSDEVQLQAADVVVDAERISSTKQGTAYRVVRRIKGSVGDTLVVQDRDENGEWFFQGYEGDLARLYLAEDDKGLYPLHGRFSVQKTRGVTP